ncbi:hypothetical protein SESBI_38401 [Sesbania bispinosa]|nr:hypothetical protein SESBI_38401 [Sesbania bispinosa]
MTVVMQLSLKSSTTTIIQGTVIENWLEMRNNNGAFTYIIENVLRKLNTTVIWGTVVVSLNDDVSHVTVVVLPNPFSFSPSLFTLSLPYSLSCSLLSQSVRPSPPCVPVSWSLSPRHPFSPPSVVHYAVAATVRCYCTSSGHAAPAASGGRCRTSSGRMQAVVRLSTCSPPSFWHFPPPE